MTKRIGWVLIGAIVGILAVGPLQSRSEAGTGPATIRITDRQQALTPVDLGAHGKSPGDMEIESSRIFQRGTGTTIGRGELICTYTDKIRARSCRGTYTLPKGKLVVGGTMLYRQFYDLAVLGGTGLYDNARGTLTVTQTHRNPARHLLVFRLVG